MRNGKRLAAWVMVAVACVGVMTLPGCGGGGGGGGGSSLPGFLALTGTVFFGFNNAGQETLQQFPTIPVNGVPVPQGGATTVAGAEFLVGPAGQQDFIQLTFNIPLDATTIFPGGGAASDGIVVFSNTEVTDPVTMNTSIVSTPVPFSTDLGGVLDAGNAAPSAGVAPAVLRIYYDPDNNLSTPQGLPQGSYTLRINETLKAFNGGGFCTRAVGGDCANQNTYVPELSFNVGQDMTPLGLKGGSTGAGASNIVQGDTAVPLNSEIELRFNKAIQFTSLVGPNNVTTLDPFITLPVPIVQPPAPPGNVGYNCVTPPNLGVDIGNLYIGYNMPTDPMSGAQEPPPLGLGVVVYMPDPILAPNLVRIRFVDATAPPAGTTPGAGSQLNGIDDPNGMNGPVQYQNYASNPEKLPIPSSNPALAGTLLNLPSIRVVTGSLPGYNPAMGVADQRAVSIDVVVASDMFADPTGLGCAIPGANGFLTDRVSNPGPNNFRFSSTVADYHLQFVFAEGPALARNPQPPDATFVGSTVGNLKGIAVVNTTATMSNLAGPGTGTQAPPWAGSQPIGTISLAANRLMNQSVLGTPVDMEIGHWIQTQIQQSPTINNNIANPGRGVTNVPGVPDTQNGTTPTGLLCVIGALPAPPCPNVSPLPPIGNFLYVVDGDSNTVKVFNGYNFELLSSITGAGAQPSGLAISPDLEFLYVADFLGNTLRRFYANPVGPVFHTLAATTPLSGSGPRAVSVQPANEDVFVANWGDNSFSLIDANLGQERDRFAEPGAVGPHDIFITNRMAGPGLTNAYTAFVINQFSNNVTIYESDSAAVPENGPTGVVKATFFGFNGPRGGCWNWQTYIGATVEPGCFIANGSAARVDELTMENFMLGPPPGFPGPPGTRDFRIQKTYVGTGALNGEFPSDVSIDNHSGLYNVLQLGVNLNKGLADPALGLGTPTFVLVSYPSAGIVGVWDYQSPSLRSMATVPGCDFMQSYYDQ